MSQQKFDAAVNSDSLDIEDRTRAGGNVESKEAIGEVVTAVTTILSAAGGMKMLLEMVKLWVEDRRERRIKLKRGDIELEIQGSMSKREIQQKLELFQELTKDARSEERRVGKERR